MARIIAHLSAILLLACVCAGAGRTARQYLSRGDDWFATPQAKQIAANILSWQSDAGGWPKNVDTTVPYKGEDRAKDLKPTFDNGATIDELRFLARCFNATHDAVYRDAVVRGIDHILKAQYPTGGWPQFYPPDRAYHRYITFNDDAMVRVMEFLREIYTSPRLAFVDGPRRKSAHEAFERGIACILKCQIKVNGKLTAWCAQHDELDYSARPGRAFELTSLSGAESVGITRLLISLDNPSPEVIAAVDAAVAWLTSAKITGIRIVTVEDKNSPKGTDKRITQDPAAPPIWARFYDIQTNEPLFADRDSVPKRQISEIGYERRNGYAWYGTWPQHLIETEYPAWKSKHPM
jgi:PelA/Pel-15E family pectate lyase